MYYWYSSMSTCIECSFDLSSTVSKYTTSSNIYKYVDSTDVFL